MARSRAFNKFINQAYGWGASVVILGALFRILHFHWGPITGGLLLTVGLVCEAVIFAISAFEPVHERYDWSLVYPELDDRGTRAKNRRVNVEEQKEVEASLSKKLDNMLRDAKLDKELIERLGNSIRNFEGAAEGLAPTAEAISSQKKYSQEMSFAAAQMESLNNLYKIQLESSNKHAEANRAIAENAAQLQEQMKTLTKNISNLNAVYGNMLTAMRPNN